MVPEFYFLNNQKEKQSDYWDVYYEMQEKVKNLFDENNITIPYEQVVVRNASEKKDK